MAMKDWETDGTHNGDPVYCPVAAWGECPYCDQINICHIADPINECDDFANVFESWDEWISLGDGEPKTIEGPDEELLMLEIDYMRGIGDFYE